MKILKLFFFLLLSLILFSSVASAVNLIDGLIAVYSFDNSAVDTLGNYDNMIIGSDCDYESFKLGGGLNCSSSGVNGRIEWPGNLRTAVHGLSSATIVTWTVQLDSSSRTWHTLGGGTSAEHYRTTADGSSYPLTFRSARLGPIANTNNMYSPHMWTVSTVNDGRYLWYFNEEVWYNITAQSSVTLPATAYFGNTGGGGTPNFKISQVLIYNRQLTTAEIVALYNDGEYLKYPFSAPVSDNFSFTAKDFYNSSFNLQNFSVIIQDHGIYTTNNGTITTNISANGTTFINTSFISDGWFNETFLNINASVLQANMTKYFNLINITYSNFTTYNGTDYVRNLGYNFLYTCPSFFSSQNQLLINGLFNSNISTSCNNKNLVSATGLYNPVIEGSFNIGFNIGFNIEGQETSNNKSFVADLNNPVITSLNFTSSEGFGSFSSTYNMICQDNIFPLLTYNMTINNEPIFYGNKTNNTLQTNTTSVPLSTGLQTLRGVCADPFSSTTNTTSATVYSNTLILIDEQDNTPFNVANVTGARVYYDDNSVFFDFKTNNTNNITFSSAVTSKLRFELVYSNGDIITRWIDVSLITTPELRVCAYKDIGLQAYQQILASNIEQPVLVKSVFANCYIGADYTRFAYQNSQILNVYTISNLYYLYKYSLVNPVLLASIDGSQESSINLDVLEFSGRTYNVRVLNPVLSVQKEFNNTLLIDWYDPRLNIQSANLEITDLDNNIIVFNNELLNFSRSTVYFDYSTLNYTNNTLFIAEVTTTFNDGSTSVIKNYFNLTGASGRLRSGLAFAFALIFTVFGLTLVKSNLAFSWFGIIVSIISLLIISMSIMTSALLVLTGVNVVVLLFILVTMFTGNSEGEVVR